MENGQPLLPLLTSDFSIGRSLFTSDSHSDVIDSSVPIPIATLAKAYALPKTVVLESSFSGFEKLFSSITKAGSQFIFGLEMVICDDVNKKDEDSFRTEHKINLFLKNENGYRDLIRLSSKASTDFFYHCPRMDMTTLNSMLSDNLMVTIPFYSSFLARNMLTDGLCRPNFAAKPIFHLENHDLPFDHLIAEKVLQYAKAENCEIINSHRCYFYKEIDAKPAIIMRCITNRQRRGVFQKPNIDHFGSNKFSWESYCRLANIPFIQ